MERVPNPLPALFLWIGCELPDIPRMAILSAADAGFRTVLFTDRPQTIRHDNLEIVDYRDVDLPFRPDEIRLRGHDAPSLIMFSDLFRYKILSEMDGWWFDCDSLILKTRDEFHDLLGSADVIFGLEHAFSINNAVIGSRSRDFMRAIYEAAIPHYPIVRKWGAAGPRLVTQIYRQRHAEKIKVVPTSCFYPVHFDEIAKVYLPAFREELLADEKNWYCLTLWGSILSNSGVKHIVPSPDSYLGDLLSRHPRWGTIRGNSAAVVERLLGIPDQGGGRPSLRSRWRKVRHDLQERIGLRHRIRI